MSPLEAAFAVLVGLVAGVLSGLFGVGGGIVMTPGLNLLASLPPVASVETPLPAIFPTAIVGSITYWRAGEVDVRAAAWIGGVGAAASVAGAAATQIVHGRVLLIVTAALLAWQSMQILRDRTGVAPSEAEGSIPVWALATVGLVAGLLSGLLGIGGGLVIVPSLAGFLGMPLKRTLGTSLVCIVAMVVPGTIVHAALGHIDWSAATLLVVGSVPGARVGARIALGTRERTLRLAVGSFLGVVALVYGVQQIVVYGRG
jgi:uncharacterized membrane protein YfcA